MIKTEGLTKVYDGVKAVDSLDLTVGKGQVFGFMGPNGAGKTTTIGMIVGLIEPTSGKCFVNDLDVTRNPLEVKAHHGLPAGWRGILLQPDGPPEPEVLLEVLRDEGRGRR